MNIDHFSTFTFGGAGIAARRIHEGLVREGISSRFVHKAIAENEVDDPTFIPFPTLPNWDIPFLNPILVEIRRNQKRQSRKIYRRHLAGIGETDEVFSTPRGFHSTYFDFAHRKSDIVHFHWIAFFVDYATFLSSLPIEIPIVWTLHDMNAFTGGCHYSQGCQKYRHGCGDCPLNLNPSSHDASRDGYRLKQRLFRKRKVHIVTPSRWLGNAAQQSQVFPASTTYDVIPYGLDTQVFSPIEKQLARQELGLPATGTLIGFGAEAIDSPRKGFHLLEEALRLLRNGDEESTLDLQGIVFGRGDLSESRFGDLPVHQVGYIEDTHKRRLVYSAMDMFIMPSLEDNQPQTGLGAMACGTPVIGFDSSGVPEIITHGKTGLVVPAFDTEKLAKQIHWFAERPELMTQMSQQARTDILDRFQEKRQADDYIALYRRIAGSIAPQKAAMNRRQPTPPSPTTRSRAHKPTTRKTNKRQSTLS